MRFLFFLFFTAFLSSICIAEEILIYQSFTDKKTVESNWKVQETKEGITMERTSSDRSSAMLFTNPTYSLEKFQQKDPNKGTDLSATREGSTLSVTGKVKDDMKTKSYDIGSTPWVQEFAFGFKDFLSSNDNEYKFEIIHPVDLGLHDMIASKEFIEELSIDKKKYTAQKLKITLQGFKKRFWKAEAWYDTQTKQLLRYKANEGPGTPTTETLLINFKQNAS